MYYYYFYYFHGEVIYLRKFPQRNQERHNGGEWVHDEEGGAR